MPSNKPEFMSPNRSFSMRLLYQFLGKHVVTLLCLSVALGVFSFLIELAFANALQAFLLELGALRENAVSLPRWFPKGLGPVLGFMLIVGVLRGFALWGQHYLQGAAHEGIRYLMRKRILHWSFHSQSVSTKDIMSLFTEYMINGSSAILSIQSILVQLTLGFFLVCILIKNSFLLTLISILALAPMAFPLRKISRRLKSTGEAFTVEWKKLNERIIVSIKNLLLMQIYGTQFIEEEKAQKNLRTYYNDSITYHVLSGIKAAMPQVVGIMLICLMSYLVQKHAYILPGALVTYLYLFVRLLQSLSLVNLFSSTFSATLPQLQILYNWWFDHSDDGPTKQIQHKDKSGIPLAPGNPGWKLCGVDFSYPEANKQVLKNFSLEIPPSSTTVIMGQSGSGKSTILNLLLGGIMPNQGSIELIFPNGTKIPLCDGKPDLLRNIGYVGSESFLVEGTIYDNLIYGLTALPNDSEIEACLRKAECQFVFELPKGLKHELTDQGQGLSAGQKQRLSLARALLRKPRALILDEATANLDVDTEMNLLKTFAQMKGQMTIVAVSHRPAFLQIADHHMELK